jgi:hypothetical protein
MSEPEIQPPEWVIEIRDGNGMFWGLPWPIRFNWFMRLLLLCSGWKHREEKV